MRLNNWQRAWVIVTAIWILYWLWTTRDMSFDAGDVPFVVRVMLLPPLVLFVIGWLVARVRRLVRGRANKETR